MSNRTSGQKAAAKCGSECDHLCQVPGSVCSSSESAGACSMYAEHTATRKVDQCAQILRDAQDAERYRWLRFHASAGQSMPGSPMAFRLPVVLPVSDLSKGLVAQHLDVAIDAAMQKK